MKELTDNINKLVEILGNMEKQVEASIEKIEDAAMQKLLKDGLKAAKNNELDINTFLKKVNELTTKSNIK